MANPPDLVRKVRQLDNDVQSLYELLAGISATQLRQANRLEEITATLADHSAILAAQSEKLDSHSVKLDSHDAKLDSHSAKLDAILELLRRR